MANGLYRYAQAQPTKRKVYFAFRYEDIMRVNNVRQSGKIGSEETKNARDFYDRSIWEKRSIEDPETLKRLMREGVQHSSVVCVLVGTNTWNSRWVKYEIARAVIDNRGLLSVGINSLPHVSTGTAAAAGVNPLSVMGVYQANGNYYLAEQRPERASSNPTQFEWKWFRYEDYTSPVSLPPYLTAKGGSYVSALSEGAGYYDYVADGGRQSLGSWIDSAATRVGR